MSAGPEAHRQRHPLVAALGCFFVAVAIGSTILVFAVLGGERRRLDELTPLTEETISDLQPGQQVLLTAAVSRRKPPLIHDLVIACEEEKVDGSWQVRRRHVQPLIVDHGDTEVLVTLRQPCPRGPDSRTIEAPHDRLHRWVGITEGTPVTIVGRVTSVSSPAVFADHYFVGTIDEYRGYLSNTRWYVLPFAFVMLMVGFVLLREWFSSRRRMGIGIGMGTVLSF
jgi:hypothetical protein